MKTVFYLIRHGESLANREGRLCGQTDLDLSPRGRRQARRTARTFRNIPVDAVLSSDLLRAVHTAEAVAKLKGLPVQTEPGFREIFVGHWEGQLAANVAAREPEALADWRRELKNVPDGESLRELCDRVRAALDRTAAQYEGKTVVIATHAMPILVLTCVFSGRPLEEAVQIPPAENGSVTKIVRDGAAWRLEEPHLS
ncbi:MAG: histidine phosphatase family protein [Clostridia bacterium]|nr:histidine phosphatase family protein [Clostridia bacterium]